MLKYVNTKCSNTFKMIATAYDSNLGGRDFDKVLMDHFQQEVKAKYNMDVYSNSRARLRLKAECEKLKKLMSSNSSQIPFNIECLMNDKDFSSRLQRLAKFKPDLCSLFSA